MAPRSPPGEGIVIVMDVGPHVRASAETTFYASSRDCLTNILQRKMFANKCKDMVGVVLFGTDGTDNDLASPGQYQNITVLQTPKLVDWDLLSLAQNLPHGNCSGDWLDALVIAMGLLHDTSGTFYSSKKIVLMTDFGGEFSDDQLSVIIEGLRSQDINLTIIGPSLDDENDKVNDVKMEHDGDAGPSNGHSSNNNPVNWNGKPKSQTQVAAETLVKRIIAEVDGISCSFDEAIPQLVLFETKAISSATWNAMLDIGPNFKLPVTGRIKIRQATTDTWKKAYAADHDSVITAERSFHKHDEDWTKVDDRDVISGYRYGTTLVPFGEENETLKYVSGAQEAVMSVVGFSQAANVPFNLRAGDSVLVVTAKDGDEAGAVALSSLIQALSELDMVAVVRKVYRKGSNPIMGALFPEITADYECLIYVGLPFCEDYRSFCYPSLEKAMDSLTNEDKSAMDAYIDAMDLSNEDDDGLLHPNNIVNPELQHYFNCLTHRAVKPDDPIPEAAPHILNILGVPKQLHAARDRAAKTLSRLLPTVKIIEKKEKLDLSSKGPTASTSKTSGGDLVSSDLTRVVVTKIGSVSPANDFQALLQGDPSNYASVFTEMSTLLIEMGEGLTGATSIDDILIPRIIDAIKVYRKESVMIEPTSFNTFITKFKDVIQARGVLRIWDFIKDENLGLISNSDSLKSNVSVKEGVEFLSLSAAQEEPKEEAPQLDYDDMLDDL